MAKRTVRCGECQLVPARRPFGQFVPISEHVRMKLAKRNSLCAHTLHPAPVSDVLRNEGCPDRDGLQRSAARGGFEAHASRILVAEDAECMAVRVSVILYLPTTGQSLLWITPWSDILPSELLLFSRLEEILQTWWCLGVILSFHGYHGAPEQHHA